MSLEWTCHEVLRWHNNLGFRQLLAHFLPKLRIPITQEYYCMSIALLTVPGKDTCPALGILVSPCHLSIYEDLGDSLGNLHFMKDLLTQKNKCNICREIFLKREKKVWQILPLWVSKVGSWRARKLAKSSDSHWLMPNSGKNTTVLIRTRKQSLVVLIQGILKCVFFTVQWI